MEREARFMIANVATLPRQIPSQLGKILFVMALFLSLAALKHENRQKHSKAHEKQRKEPLPTSKIKAKAKETRPTKTTQNGPQNDPKIDPKTTPSWPQVGSQEGS